MRQLGQKISALSEKLQKERPKEPGYQDQFAAFDHIPHFFSNQHIPLPVLRNLEKRQPLAPTQNNVAILLGESFSVSIFPMLLESNIQTVIFTDKKSLILDHLRFMMHCVTTCATLAEFYEAYLDETRNPALTTPIYFTQFSTGNDDLTNMSTVHLDKPTRIDIRMLARFLQNHKYLLGETFFCSSENRYQTCRNALNKLEICYLNIDLLSNTEAQQFSQLLRREQCQIQLMNITNLHEYDSDICALRALTPKKHADWKMRGRLFNTIEIIVGENQASCWFMFAHMSKESNYKSLQMNFADSFENLKSRINKEIDAILTWEFEPVISLREHNLTQWLAFIAAETDLASLGMQGILLTHSNPKGEYAGHNVRCFTIKPLETKNPSKEDKQLVATKIHEALTVSGFFCKVLAAKNGNPSVTIDLNRSCLESK